jgi:hypothetical protein
VGVDAGTLSDSASSDMLDLRVVGKRMKLPNSEAAIVEIEKLRDYCLSPVHPRGRHKARVFESVLGMTFLHVEDLRAELLNSALKDNAVLGEPDQFGIRYVVDFELKRGGCTANVRSCWIVRTGEIAPRFVTCYIR